MANISTITYNGKVIAETEEPGNVAVTYDGKTIANIGAGETKNILCNGKVMKTNLYIGAKTLLCEMAQMITDIAIAVKSAFPEAPTAYNLIGTYTSSQTWTAPEDGWFQIEVYGASGNGGVTAVFGGSSGGAGIGTGGGGGGGGYAASRIKMKKGDAVSLVSAAVGATSSATITSSIETYSALSVTSGASGTDGVAPSWQSATAGTGGAGGVASGGNYYNVNGNTGGNGNSKTKAKKAGETYAGGAGGASAVSGGNVGGTAQMVTVTKKWKPGIGDYLYYGEISGGTSGSAGFIKIYAGNTNGTGGGGEEITIDPILENNSWEVISQVAKSGKAAETWSVGDEKSFNLNGTTYTARIIGFDHDDVTDSASYGRTKAGITFEMKEIDAGDVVVVTQNYDYNWETGDARLNGIPARFTNLLPNDMRTVIVPVNKTFARSYSNTYVSTTSDDVFLLSEQEVFGVKTNAKAIEGSQYAYYAAGNSKIKYRSGVANEWALRSIAFKDSGYAYSVIVKKDGTVSVDKGASSYLSPAFCV